MYNNNMKFTKYIEQKTKEQSKPRRILFIDGNDERAQKAALLHKISNWITPVILVKNKDDASKIDVEKIVIDDWANKEDILIKKYVERRKGKESEADAKKVIFDMNFFGMLMLELGEVDGVVGGLTSPSSAVLRAAFKVVGPKPGVKTISSVMVMTKELEWYIFTDISVNISPSVIQLVDIAKNAADFASLIGLERKISFLSFSTSGSALHPRSILMREATKHFNKDHKLKEHAIGEIQFDAAFDNKIRDVKYDGRTFDDKSSIFVFPSLEAANIGYKIAERMGEFGAVGPIITGLNKPVNDLSRGSDIQAVYDTALITAIQKR